jgi:hypothetical protein
MVMHHFCHCHWLLISTSDVNFVGQIVEISGSSTMGASLCVTVMYNFLV